MHHVIDVETDPSCGPEFRRNAAERGFRSFVAVPMLRGADPLGMIFVGRAQPGAFSPAEIALLQTFADQAVIAVENGRLLAELQVRNADLTESLAWQTATGDILRAIAASPSDVQPVFDAIVQNGVQLCEATICMLVGYDGETMSVLAMQNIAHEGSEELRRALSTYPTPASNAGRAILDRRVVHRPDVLLDEEYGLKDVADKAHYRAALAVPMLREAEPMGAVVAGRAHPGPFSDRQNTAPPDVRRPGRHRDRERAADLRAPGADGRAARAPSASSRRSARWGRRSARRWIWRRC